MYLACLWVAFFGYVAALSGCALLPGRAVAGLIGACVLAFALAPPLLSQDVFSYVSYARLGAKHGLNPYVDVPLDVPSDPSLPFVGRGAGSADRGWQDDVSAYGPLFTLATYPLAPLSVPAAMWTLKAVAALSVLGLAGLAARLAPARGVDRRTAAVFVALNPLVLVHVVGGAHNDGLMMLVALAGCGSVLALREPAGGAALASAVAIKVSAAFAAPFALIGTARRGRLLAGALAATAAIAVAAAAAFGWHALEAIGLAGENQAEMSHYSVPSTVARITGSDPDAVRVAALVAYALAVAGLVWRCARGADWIAMAGWAALGLLLATGWLLPWYLVWLLPFAALARSGPLAAAAIALTAFQLINRVPL